MKTVMLVKGYDDAQRIHAWVRENYAERRSVMVPARSERSGTLDVLAARCRKLADKHNLIIWGCPDEALKVGVLVEERGFKLAVRDRMPPSKSSPEGGYATPEGGYATGVEDPEEDVWDKATPLGLHILDHAGNRTGRMIPMRDKDGNPVMLSARSVAFRRKYAKIDWEEHGRRYLDKE